MEGLTIPFQAIADGLEYVATTLLSPLNGIWNTVSNLATYLNPFSDTFVLKVILIPDAEHQALIEQNIESTRMMINDKFNVTLFKTFADEVISAGSGLGGGGGGGWGPDVNNQFTINLPAKYGGTETPFVDFEPFLPYLSWVKNFIRVLIWGYFLIKTFRRLPNMIQGAV